MTQTLDPKPAATTDPAQARARTRTPATSTSLVLDLRGTPRVELIGPSGSFAHQLSPRRTELLAALMLAGVEGRTAAGLTADLFADATRTVTVRAEVSRIRRALGSVLLSEPYRLAPRRGPSCSCPTTDARCSRRPVPP